MSDFDEFEIKVGANFKSDLSTIIPHEEVAEDFMKALRFALRHFPYQGRNTGRAAPAPIYAWPLAKTDRHPACIAYYAIVGKIVWLSALKITEANER